MDSLIVTMSMVGAFMVVSYAPLLFVRWLSIRRLRGRKTPLTVKLLRGPGSSLRADIEEVSMDADTWLFSAALVPPLSFAAYVGQIQYTGISSGPFARGLLLVLTVVICVFAALRVNALVERRFKLRSALDAEVAVGQELNQLMRQGAVVFHDFPAENFNIDHVVVTRRGVFAVETKSRLKPDRGGGSKDAKVTSDGNVLAFPGWRESKPVEQARRQANWLRHWLSSAVGEPVTAQGVVALPGWYVERVGKSDVLVISGREAPSLMRAGQSGALSESLMQRIVHQIEQRCRDIEPVSLPVRRNARATKPLSA